MKKTIIISLISFMIFFPSGIKINAASIHKHVFTPSILEEDYYNTNILTDTINNQTEHLSTSEKGWFYQPRNDGIPPEEPQAILDLLNKYSAYYVGDTSKKVLYLTFDEGYENGYTPQILDVLKRQNIKAAFFVVKPYITGNKEIIKRMVEEGHLVCNHSTNHPSMASIYDKNKFIKEFTGVEDAYREVTGKEMSKFFRPPMGKYSELSLHYTADCGYKTIFWSFAYDDWNIKKQPSHEYAKKKILQRTHNGAIILLHAVSKTNAEILEEVITEWKSQGYEFKNLDELSLRVN
jgi:peptidoglycan-N-acetylmuramic acid deacetylase